MKSWSVLFSVLVFSFLAKSSEIQGDNCRVQIEPAGSQVSISIEFDKTEGEPQMLSQFDLPAGVYQGLFEDQIKGTYQEQAYEVLGEKSQDGHRIQYRMQEPMGHDQAKPFHEEITFHIDSKGKLAKIEGDYSFPYSNPLVRLFYAKNRRGECRF